MSTESAFDTATENAKEINRRLADTDGKIAQMQFAGAVGYHLHIAAGETSTEFLWKTALLQALDEVVLREVHLGDDHSPEEAADELQFQLGDFFDPWTTDALTERFEERLRGLKESQQKVAAEQDGDGE